MKKVSNTEAELKKSVAYKKACNLLNILVMHCLNFFKLTIKALTLCLDLINRIPLFMNMRKSCLLGCKLFCN